MPKRNKKLIVLSLIIFLLTFLVTPLVVSAQTDQIKVLKETLNVSATAGGLPVGVDSPDLPTRIGTAINFLFSIIGLVFLGMILIGGILWMMAGGNEEKVDRAVKFIIGGIEGVIITFMSYALLYVVLAALRYATSGL